MQGGLPRAQQTGVPPIGFLNLRSPGPMTANRVTGFPQGMSEVQLAPS